jgi:hypothetical protein
MEDIPLFVDSTYVLVLEAWRLLMKDCRISKDEAGGDERYILLLEDWFGVWYMLGMALADIGRGTGDTEGVGDATWKL